MVNSCAFLNCQGNHAFPTMDKATNIIFMKHILKPGTPDIPIHIRNLASKSEAFLFVRIQAFYRPYCVAQLRHRNVR
jgi:hypothetical protein